MGKKINLPDSVEIKIKATHFEPFINKNAVKYTEKAVSKGHSSWTKPFNKPQLIGHDKTSSPIGRIFNQEIVKNKNPLNGEPPNYIRLYARINDQASIEKVLDGRFNTVSVGSKSSRVICSECSQVITEDGLCDHKKGSYNEKGEMIYWIIDEIEYTEDSFVNEPADEFAGIEEIKIKDKWVPYQEFLDNRSSLLKEISLEDCMSTQTDAKLSTEARNKLSESAFCGPGRSFPAHDKAHVTAGLRLLNRSNFSDATKAKIKACLYRKGKRYGIVPTQDELQADPDILVRGVDDEWTTEQRAEVEAFFKDNPDADLPETEITNPTDGVTAPVTPTEPPKIEDMKKPELVTLATALQKEVEDLKKAAADAVAANDTKIAELNKKIDDASLLATQKEEEINKFLDENAVLNKKLRDSIVSNIIDLKMTDNNNEERTALTEKYVKRSIESLTDTLNDLRSKPVKQTNSDTKVANTTIQAEDKNSDKGQNNNDEKLVDKFSLFDRDRSSTEE
jgi:hypothetical protein